MSKKFGQEGGGEYQDFPSKITCVTVPKLSVGESFTIALISGIKKVWIRKGLVSSFSVKNFLSHSAESFRGGEGRNPLAIQKLRVSEKFGQYVRGGGSIKIFCRNFFVSVPKNFVGEPFCDVTQKVSDSEKVYGLERGWGSINFLRRKLFVPQCRKFS